MKFSVALPDPERWQWWFLVVVHPSVDKSWLIDDDDTESVQTEFNSVHEIKTTPGCRLKRAQLACKSRVYKTSTRWGGDKNVGQRARTTAAVLSVQ